MDVNMPVIGLKPSLHLRIQLHHDSEDEFEECFSDFERSDTFGSTTSEDLRVNTIFNAVADGTLGAPTPPTCSSFSDPTKEIPLGSLEIGQRVLCRDGSKDTWQRAVVRSVHPIISVMTDGANIKRPFKNIRPFTSILDQSESHKSPNAERSSKRMRLKNVGKRVSSVGGNVMHSPRNVTFALVEYANSESVENLAVVSPPVLSPKERLDLLKELKKDDSFFDVLFE